MTRPAEKNRTSPENLSWQPGGVSWHVPRGLFFKATSGSVSWGHMAIALGNLTNSLNKWHFSRGLWCHFKLYRVRESQTWEAQSGKDVKSSKKLKKDTKDTRIWTQSVWQNVGFYVFKKWILKADKLTRQVRHLLTLVSRAHMVDAMASYVHAGTEVLTLTWKAFYKLSPLCMIPCAHTLSLLRFSHHLNVNVNYDWHWLKKNPRDKFLKDYKQVKNHPWERTCYTHLWRNVAKDNCCSPGLSRSQEWPWICNPSASNSQILGLQECPARMCSVAKGLRTRIWVTTHCFLVWCSPVPACASSCPQQALQSWVKPPLYYSPGDSRFCQHFS